jgi:DeoR family transcriptional regulator of aga operon
VAYIPRHDGILKILSHVRSITVQELTERLSVSEVTIRKDLAFLEESGIIVRTRAAQSSPRT